MERRGGREGGEEREEWSRGEGGRRDREEGEKEGREGKREEQRRCVYKVRLGTELFIQKQNTQLGQKGSAAGIPQPRID